MNASVVDLRYRMKEILESLDRRESVNVLYHGKVKGILSPVTLDEEPAVKLHPFFGMNTSDESVDTTLEQLRGGRYSAL